VEGDTQAPDRDTWQPGWRRQTSALLMCSHGWAMQAGGVVVEFMQRLGGQADAENAEHSRNWHVWPFHRQRTDGHAASDVKFPHGSAWHVPLGATPTLAQPAAMRHVSPTAYVLQFV